ncbi:MAG: hypothetical protein IKW90_03440 [Lachnospiraceae bacterium]|nr:hypothetical protein [Lachnospiraceae bacterium]
MNKEEIKDYIEKYIQNYDEEYAVMIDGSWGSGKTYLYKKTLLNAIQKLESGRGKPRTSLYISLYGIRSIEALSKQLLTSCMINSKDHWKEPFREAYRIYHGLIEIISDAVTISVGSVSFDPGKMFKKLYDFLENHDMVVCFDDFERCTISLNEILGFINNLTEHCNCKVIILADENNIGKIYANTNLEAKYQTILSGKTLVKDDKKDNYSKGINTARKDSNIPSITIREVKDLNECLYSENYIYKDVKEKVIGKTLYYYPDMKEIILDIVLEKYKDPNNAYSIFISECIDDISSQFISKGNRNLRIVKKWVNSFHKIFVTLNQYFPKETNTLHDDILEEFLQYSIWVVCAEGLNKKILSSGNSYVDYVYYEGHEYTQIVRNSFIDSWIIRGAWDDGDFCKTCKSVISRLEKDNLNNPKTKVSRGTALGVLQSWTLLTDDEVDENINLLLDELKNGLYEFRDFGIIIAILQDLHSVGFEMINIKEIQNEMIALINKYTDTQNYDDIRPIIFDSEKKKQDYLEVYKPIRDLFVQKCKDIGKTLCEEETAYLSGDNFDAFCRKYEEYFIRHKSFMEYIDIEKLVKLINSSNQEGIYKIGAGIRFVYHMGNIKEFYISDTDKLSELYEILNDKNKVKYDNSITKRVAIESIIELVKDVLNKLGVETDN